MTLFTHNNTSGYELLMPAKIGFNESIKSISQEALLIAEDIIKGYSVLTDRGGYARTFTGQPYNCANKWFATSRC